MGTPLPEDAAGNPCFLCWGIDKPFGPVTTPGRIKIQLEDVEPVGDWTSREQSILLMDQYLNQQGNPCNYFLKVDDIEFILFFVLPTTFFEIRDLTAGVAYFFGNSDQTCVITLDNLLVPGPGVAGTGGRVHFFI